MSALKYLRPEKAERPSFAIGWMLLPFNCSSSIITVFISMRPPPRWGELTTADLAARGRNGSV